MHVIFEQPLSRYIFQDVILRIQTAWLKSLANVPGDAQNRLDGSIYVHHNRLIYRIAGNIGGNYIWRRLHETDRRKSKLADFNLAVFAFR